MPGTLPRHFQLHARLCLHIVALAQKHLRDRPQHQPARRRRRFGEKAVQDGKITRKQLDMLKRNEAAHANAIEHFPMFIGSALFAVVSKVPNETINRACTVYSLARVVHGIAYLVTDTVKFSYIRSLAWWASTFSCLYLLWQSGSALNAGLA